MEAAPDTNVKPGSSSKSRGGWGPLKLLPRVPLPGVPIPRLPLPGIPGLRKGSSSSKVASAGATASITLAATDASLALPAGNGSSSSNSGSAANSLATTASLAAPPPKPKPQLKPASDVFAGALARALSQSTIHPLDTLKVRLQTRAPAPAGHASSTTAVPGLSKFGQLVPPPSATATNLQAMSAGLASLYKGVVGAASGAGIAIGAYFACYGVACNLLTSHSNLSPSAVAFVAGGAAAAGSSVVKVPLAVCIRSVQAGVYPNVFAAANSITSKAGPRGLFTGFFPTLLEDVPDMAVKFAAYESMRQLHSRMRDGRVASPQEDFAMGALAGALAAAATTPLDVIKTRMMCAAASRPTMVSAARDIMAASGPKGFLAGIGARALSNGINSAVFFCFFEAIRSSLQENPLDPAATLDNAGRAVMTWAAQARERAASIPRALSSAVLVLPGMAAGGRRGTGHLGWATAGAGADWLGSTDDGGGRPGVSAEQQQLLLLADADDGGPGGLLDACRAFLDYGEAEGAGLSLSLLARASPLRLDHHSQIAMAMAALKGVEAGSCLPLDEE